MSTIGQQYPEYVPLNKCILPPKVRPHLEAQQRALIETVQRALFLCNQELSSYRIEQVTPIDFHSNCHLQIVDSAGKATRIYMITPQRPDEFFCKTAQELSSEILSKAETHLQITANPSKSLLLSESGSIIDTQALQGHTAHIDNNGFLLINDKPVEYRSKSGTIAFLHIDAIRCYGICFLISDKEIPSKIYIHDTSTSFRKELGIRIIQIRDDNTHIATMSSLTPSLFTYLKESSSPTL